MNKKFIIVQDESTANKLISSGFQLVSQVNGTYTFMNETQEKFNFASIDNTKLHFTNILHI